MLATGVTVSDPVVVVGEALPSWPLSLSDPDMRKKGFFYFLSLPTSYILQPIKEKKVSFCRSRIDLPVEDAEEVGEDEVGNWWSTLGCLTPDVISNNFQISKLKQLFI